MLNVGDILLTSNDTLRSKAIQKATDGHYSHVLLHVGGGSCIHSDSQGVHSINLQRILLDSVSAGCVLRWKDSVSKNLEIKKAVDYARTQVGKQYSKTEAVRSKLYRADDTSQKADRQFCSRLVAQAYAYGGHGLVANPDYCFPEDIVASESLSVIADCIHVASDEEIEFALSDNPISKQTQNTNEILNFARSLLGSKIQTLGDLAQEIIHQPEHDEAISKKVEEVGYLDYWKIDVQKNPWRYDGNIFSNLDIPDETKMSSAIYESNQADEAITMFKRMLVTQGEVAEKTKLRYFRQQAELYENLVSIMEKRKFAAATVVIRLIRKGKW